MPASVTVRIAPGARNPNQAPSGENGMISAAASAVRVEATSSGLGASRQGRPRVRIRKTTSV